MFPIGSSIYSTKIMIHSEILATFCGSLYDEGELINPETNLEEFLGPNWETVLHFWKYIGSLSDDQLNVVSARYDELPYYEGFTNVINLALEVSDYSNEAAETAYENIQEFGADYVAEYATYELICMHLLLEQGKKLLYVPLFDGL